MQPRCVEIAECGLRLLHTLRGKQPHVRGKQQAQPALSALPANVRLLRRYVSNGDDDGAQFEAVARGRSARSFHEFLLTRRWSRERCGG